MSFTTIVQPEGSGQNYRGQVTFSGHTVFLDDESHDNPADAMLAAEKKFADALFDMLKTTVSNNKQMQEVSKTDG